MIGDPKIQATIKAGEAREALIDARKEVLQARRRLAELEDACTFDAREFVRAADELARLECPYRVGQRVRCEYTEYTAENGKYVGTPVVHQGTIVGVMSHAGFTGVRELARATMPLPEAGELGQVVVLVYTSDGNTVPLYPHVTTIRVLSASETFEAR